MAVALRKPLLAVTPVPAPVVLRDIAYRFRFVDHPLDPNTSPLTFRVNSLAAVKIHVRPGKRGTEIRYEVDATGFGWILVLMLLFTGYLGLVAVILAVYIHIRAARFARTRVLPAIGAPPLGTLPGPDMRSFLIEGLSEARRLASEALDWEREARQNAILLILVGSLALWVLTLFGLAVFLPPVPERLALAVLTATLVSAVAALTGSWFISRRLVPLIRELERDAEAYREAVAREVYGVPAPEGTRGKLELLLDAAQRSPRWREIRRRHRLWQDPWAGFTIFMCAYAAFFPLLLAILVGSLAPEWRAGLAAFGTLSVLVGVWIFQRERREVRERDERDRRDWERRRHEIETALWKLLSG